MTYPQNFGYLLRAVSLRGTCTAILALIFLATAGFTPMIGSVVVHSTADSVIALDITGSFEENDDILGASATCDIHIVCVAIEATSTAINFYEFAGAKHLLTLQSSVPRATGPPLLHPPIIS